MPVVPLHSPKMSSQGPNLFNIGLLAAAGFLGYLFYATGGDEGK